MATVAREAQVHFTEVQADYERRNLTLQGREMALREEIQTAQYQLQEYAAMAAVEEDYLGLLRGELIEVGEAIDAERADLAKAQEREMLTQVEGIICTGDVRAVILLVRSYEGQVLS